VVAALASELPFGDIERGRKLIRSGGDRLAAVVVEPIVERAPAPEWFAMLREETRSVGAVLILDEVKTAFRLAIGGAAERWQIDPDLVVLGKALANGFPLAAVGGRREIMEEARRSWISSTLATEFLGFAAAEATLEVMVEARVPLHLGRIGGRLQAGLERLAGQYPALLAGVGGIPEMCFLRFMSEEAGARLARLVAERGVLFKRSAYNFVSLAHDLAAVDGALGVLEEACREA